jgi:hypothetical protein
VIIASGETEVSFSVLINGDIFVEDDETVTLEVTGTDRPDVVVDAVNGSATHTITNDDSANSAPIATDDEATANEDESVVIDLLGNDEDPDGAPLEFVAIGLSSHGSITDNGDGTVTYTPDENFNGEDGFTYVITDGMGGVDQAMVSITIDPVNDAPEVKSPVEFIVPENTTDVGIIEASDAENDVLEYDVLGSGDGALFQIDDTGVVSFIDPPDFEALIDPTLTFTVRVSDGTDSSDVAVAVTVSEVDEEPAKSEIKGSSSRDYLRGTEGDDILRSMGGSSDRMDGGDGADCFQFGLEETTNGSRERDLIRISI